MTDSRGVVLVVEDEPAIADLLRMYLSREGFQVLVETEGQEALTAVADHRPSCILLDVGLPDMDGRDAVKIMRSSGFRSPIIMLTGHDSEGDTVLGLEAGANDYVVKPFRPEEFVARVRRLAAHNSLSAAS